MNQISIPGTTITSPNYPNPYENNVHCVVNVTFPAGSTVLIEFDQQYEIENHASCNYDYIEARDGPFLDSNLIGNERLCGSTAPAPIQSTGNTMILIFHTDYSVTKTGFKIVANPGKYEQLFEKIFSNNSF